MASMLLRSAKSAIARPQIHRRGFLIETGFARHFSDPASKPTNTEQITEPQVTSTTLEWLIPSPPGFHTFGELPVIKETITPSSPNSTNDKPQLDSSVSIFGRIKSWFSG